jgi:hypothetical protein
MAILEKGGQKQALRISSSSSKNSEKLWLITWVKSGFSLFKV